MKCEFRMYMKRDVIMYLWNLWTYEIQWSEDEVLSVFSEYIFKLEVKLLLVPAHPGSPGKEP